MPAYHGLPRSFFSAKRIFTGMITTSHFLLSEKKTSFFLTSAELSIFLSFLIFDQHSDGKNRIDRQTDNLGWGGGED